MLKWISCRESEKENEKSKNPENKFFGGEKIAPTAQVIHTKWDWQCWDKATCQCMAWLASVCANVRTRTVSINYSLSTYSLWFNPQLIPCAFLSLSPNAKFLKDVWYSLIKTTESRERIEHLVYWFTKELHVCVWTMYIYSFYHKTSLKIFLFFSSAQQCVERFQYAKVPPNIYSIFLPIVCWWVLCGRDIFNLSFIPIFLFGTFGLFVFLKSLRNDENEKCVHWSGSVLLRVCAYDGFCINASA